MIIQKKNLEEKFGLIKEYWVPKIAGEINDSQLKLAKVKGEFDWHFHENEDELFYVFKGKLIIRLRNKDIELNEGEFVVIPKGVEHKPVAEEVVHLLLLEPKSTLNTGNLKNEKTVDNPEWI